VSGSTPNKFRIQDFDLAGRGKEPKQAEQVIARNLERLNSGGRSGCVATERYANAGWCLQGDDTACKDGLIPLP